MAWPELMMHHALCSRRGQAEEKPDGRRRPVTGQRRGDEPTRHWASPATGPWQPDTPVNPRDGRLAAERGRRAGRWLVLALVLVLVPLLMVLVGWVIG
jgi:hypothetical protein